MRRGEHPETNTTVKAIRVGSADGFPNNPDLPLPVYRQAVRFDRQDPAAMIERMFGDHGWGGAWRDGVFPYHHYHSNAHEALGVASGRARIQFGGPGGPVIRKASAGAGGWSVSARFEMVESGTLDIFAEYQNRLEVALEPGTPNRSLAQAAYAFTLTITNKNTEDEVFSWTPDALNDTISLSSVGEITRSDSGNISTTTGQLSTGIEYVLSIKGTESVNQQLIPEPATVSILAIGGIALIRRRR